MSLARGIQLGPYEVVAPIGAGGMGEVYRARDNRIGRDVAVKVLPASLASDAMRLRRFEQEARAAGQLNHPNILTLHDVGTHEGAPYLVTELLEGETLQARLALGVLPWPKAVEIAAAMAEGLAAAHAKGIVHRDLKPANVFLTADGRVKVLDFGLAKLWEPTEQDLSASTFSRSDPGHVLGTVGYMSPEQTAGRAVDTRSDLFSLGCVLYEMVSGRRAFARKTAPETMAATLNEEPPPPSDAPVELRRLIAHCLEKDPEARFQSARDLAFGLRAVSNPGVVASAPASLEAIKTVAVLPFENLGASDDDYFADGMADEVRGKLAALPALQVIARSSSNEYKNTTKTQKQIASELGVQYLLTATVRWEKKTGGVSRVRVSPELVLVAEGPAPTTRWQRSFEAVLEDVFQVQADIAEQVTQALDVALGDVERRRVVARPTENLAAYQAYLQGNDATGWFASTSAADLKRAIADYERAVALDAGFALAWAQLSRACSALYFNGIPDLSRLERAKEAAERALALDAALPTARLAQGDYYSNGLNDWSRALEQYALGLQAAPRDSDLLTAAAAAQQRAGRWQESLASLRQAQEFDPRSAATARCLTVALLFLRRYTEAHAAADRARALAPRKPNVIQDNAAVFLGQGDLGGARAALAAAPREVDQTDLVAYLASYGDLYWVLDDAQQELLLRLTPGAFGDDRLTWGLALAQAAALRRDAGAARKYAEEARRAAEQQLERAPADAQRHAFLGVALAYLGQKAEAVREGKRGVALLPVANDAYLGPYIQHQLARIYLRVGEPAKALEQLEPLLKIPYYLSPGWLRIDPEWTPLRENPRFRKLMGV